MIIALLVLYQASILASAATAIVYRKYLAERKLGILVPFLTLVFLQECFLGIANILDLFPSNTIAYNIYRPVSTLVFAFIYYHIPFMSPLRKLIGGITLTYLFLLLTNYCFFESIFANRGYMTLARGFILTFYALLFLFRYFNLDNSEVERYWRPLLWITAGLAIFYPVVSISLAFQEYLVKRTPGDQPRIYQLIPQVMSIFMYSCFTYAFYLCRKIK